MELYFMTWPEVETYLKTKKSIIIPVGSTEQHGPTGLIGTDYLSAWEVAKKVGEKTKTLVASPICYGMALHHTAFPGSSALKPSTFIQMISEIVLNFSTTGFTNFIFINGHGGNTAPLQSAFSETLSINDRLSFQLFDWWKQSEPMAYENKHFGDKNGFHATIGEISVTQFCHPEAFKADRPYTHKDTPKKTFWPLSPIQFRETFSDGRMGSDPSLASPQHGKAIFDLAVNQIAAALT